MFVNRISNVSNIKFRGYQHLKNSVGDDVTRFNVPFDSDNETCQIAFYRVKTDSKYNHTIIPESKVLVDVPKEGAVVNVPKLLSLEKNEPYQYQIILTDDKGNQRYVADTGMQERHGDEIYNHVSTRTTQPIVNGAACLIMPDSFNIGAKYRPFNDPNTGEIFYDSELQRSAEKKIRNFSNVFGGGIAGIEAEIPNMKGVYTRIFGLPITNSDDLTSHGYAAKNNFQIASRMGTAENFSSLMRKLYANGMTFVNDLTLTSEGLEGIHFRYAQRWMGRDPQTRYWFRMDGIDNQSLGLGVIPENDENLRHRIVNPMYEYILQKNGIYKKALNPYYNPNKETYFQIYDNSQVTNEQISNNELIRKYEAVNKDDELDINTHDDTIIPYAFEIDPKEYDARIDVINDLNSKNHAGITLDSAEGTKIAGSFPAFNIRNKTEGGFVTWDANTDLVKLNFHISGYDIKRLESILNPAERQYVQDRIMRGTYEVQDYTVQVVKYWAQKVKDIQTSYTAQKLGNVETVDDLNKLIEKGLLPAQAKLDEETLTNILNAEYKFEPKGILERDDVTLKALMKLPLDSLELGENTLGVLSTSFFSNRATTPETIGVSRFDLMKQGNPHLTEEYKTVYKRVEKLYTHELKHFADSVIEKVNDMSDEKLLDENYDYTEYGEYIIDLIGQDIAKYALLKSLAGDSFKVKVLPEGELTYDYDAIRENTTLKGLGIDAYSPEDEALKLEKRIKHGLKLLSKDDVNFIASAVLKRFRNTNTESFRLAEAIVDRSGLGLEYRLDASKDIGDMDAVRNRDDNFDEAMDSVINYWRNVVSAIKSINPNAYIVAEVTDIMDLMKDTYGLNSEPWNPIELGQKYVSEPDFMAKFYNETGITTEAAYSYFFTDLLNVFSGNFENGWGDSKTHDAFKNRMDALMKTRSIDYIRNLYTFMGNHDKPRTLHGLSIDMRLFHRNLIHSGANFGENHEYRMDVIKALSGSRAQADVPIELRLNVDNNDYFRTVSSKAAAQAKALVNSVYEDLDGLVSEEDINLIAASVADLANGNYLGDKNSIGMRRINIKSLATLEDSLNEMLKLAENHGLILSRDKKLELITKAVDRVNQGNFIDNYLVHGDFNTAEYNIGDNNKRKLKELIGGYRDANDYDIYAVQLARLMKDALSDAGINHPAINSAAKDFVFKYNSAAIKAATSSPDAESPYEAMKKNGFGVRDIHSAIELAVKQAEYKSGRQMPNRDKIIEKVYQSITEPAVTKAAMYMEFLKALSGTPTMYAGDERGMTGYDEKAKNVYLQNRNALIREGMTDYRKKIMELSNGTVIDRQNPQLHSLNDGTPYAMDVHLNGKVRQDLYSRLWAIEGELHKGSVQGEQRNILEKEKEQLIKDIAKMAIAYLMQSANGDATISIFYAGDVEHGSRVDYFQKYGLTSKEDVEKFFKDNNIVSINPENKYIPIQPKAELDYITMAGAFALPVGTVFMNANGQDKARYVIKQMGEKLGLVKEGGGKIILDGLTSKNGVMVLKKLAFRGNSKPYLNTRYNIVSNPYKHQNISEVGKNLSLISK